MDRTAEQLITRSCREATPGGRIVGEELSPALVSEGLVWIVDPLDGTTNFLHGVPVWAVSIAARWMACWRPAWCSTCRRGEQFEAVRGHGASLGGSAAPC